VTCRACVARPGVLSLVETVRIADIAFHSHLPIQNRLFVEDGVVDDRAGFRCVQNVNLSIACLNGERVRPAVSIFFWTMLRL
jgi:hypothetical protein